MAPERSDVYKRTKAIFNNNTWLRWLFQLSVFPYFFPKQSSDFISALPSNLDAPCYGEWDSPTFVILTFKCHLQVCWGNTDLIRGLSSPHMERPGRSRDLLTSTPDTPPPKKKNLDIANVCWPLIEKRHVERQGEKKKRSKACKTLSVLTQEVFYFPCDLSMPELSDTSSGVLTRHCCALIEVGLSHPCSPIILFSMGQWEVGGSPLSTQHWQDCYLPPTAPQRGC